MSHFFQEETRKVAEATYDAIYDYLAKDGYTTEPHLREVTGSYLEHRGKCLRPAILNFCCEAASGSREKALYAGAAVEMFHTWTLMHDDVIDHDDFRRGKPTAHKRGEKLALEQVGVKAQTARQYGMDLAILGGDALQGMAADMLGRVPGRPELLLDLMRRMCAKLNCELLSGEQMDIRLSLTPWDQVTQSAVMEMMRLKTGALLAYCAETGVAIGEDRAPEQSPNAENMAKFAELCGLAFQMKDDLLGVFGDEAKFGKPIGSDIREGKRTILMLETLARTSVKAREAIQAILGRSDAGSGEIDLVRDVISGTGADQTVRQLAEDYVNRALDILMRTYPNSDLLREWALSMVDRKI